MRRRSLRWVCLLLAVLIAGSFGLSLALRGGWARRGLLARLSAGFGRPVEVGRFGFSLLSGPRLEAQSFTVYDDPRFGQEYFLRAEQLTASVRWLALLKGRFEFDTVSLTRPSLNLVRLSDGQWNIESWLPPLPPDSGAGTTAASAVESAGSQPAGTPAARLSRIEVDSGRINFKRDLRKLPLALVAVTGRFDHDAAGHWNIDVQANPMRAPASLQQAGTLRIRGVVGGVSARLRPATLSLIWEEASLADLSRLAQGRDIGIRGTLNAEMTARIDDSPSRTASWGEWSIDGSIRLRGVHGWAMSGRAADPGANINVQARWRPADYRLIVSRCVIEAPQSQVTGAIDLDWSRGFQPQAEVTSARVGFADLLAWRRAFHAGVADDLSAEGTLDLQARLSGWPLRIERFGLFGPGPTIRSAQLPGAIRVGPIVTQWAGQTLKIRRTTVSLPVPVPAASPVGGNFAPASQTYSAPLLVEGSIGPLPFISASAEAGYRWALSGPAPRAQDLLAIARAWGSPAASSWTAEGPIGLQVTWTGSLRSGTSAASGTIQARGVQFGTVLLNRPLLVTATVELRGGQRRFNLQSVQAFGAQWTGSLRSAAENGAWEFDLSAGRLDAANFYDWLGSQDRPNLLRRMLPFAAGAASNEAAGRASALENLRARGRLRVAELSLAPLQVAAVDAAATIDGPSIVLRQGRADLLGGQWSGTLEARLSPAPAYSFNGRFTRLDLGNFAEIIMLPGRVSGSLSGELKLAAGGWDRAALAASLQGEGSLSARDASLGPLEVNPPAVGAAAGSEHRPAALTGRVLVGAGRVRLDHWLLTRQGEETELTGTVDFARRLDLRIASAPRRDSWTVAGTLDAPLVTSDPPSAPAARAGVPSASR